MVQGLAFLSKKSWHTKNLANQEKVWMAEQRKEAEASKTKELARQIQQEREQEELDRISGKKTHMDRGINWMYEGGTTGELAKEDAAKRAEEFLMGKEFGGETVKGDFDSGEQKEGINNVVSTANSDAQIHKEQNVEEGNHPEEESVKDRNESFRLRVEDPMFLVNQKQREKMAKANKNRELYERVVGSSGRPDTVGEEDLRSSSKTERKREKKKRSRRDHEDRKRRHLSRSRSKERWHKREERSRSRSRSDSRERHSHRSKRHRSERRHRRSMEDRRSSRHRDHGDDHRHRRRRTSDDADRSPMYRNHDDHESSPRRLSRHADDVDNVDYERKIRGHNRRERRHGHDCNSKSPCRRSRDREDKEYIQRNDKVSDYQCAEKANSKGYGLQGKKVQTTNHDDLGPDRELLRKAREERSEERKRIRDSASSRRHVTAEDRAKALEAMQTDAKAREEEMTRKSHHRTFEVEDRPGPGRGKATFLDDMAKKTHGIQSDGVSLSSRVAQNRHTNQRLHDSFL